MAVRSRTRNTRSGNPFITLGALAALIGIGLVSLAAWYYVSQRRSSEYNKRIARGLMLLDKLAPLAADYYYSGKGAIGRPEPLPAEAWAAFKEHESDPDFVDAMVTKSVGAENHFVDAFRYKTGRTVQGEAIPGKLMTTHMWWHGEPGPAPEPNRARVQILDSETSIGGQIRKIIVLRRPLLANPDKTELEYGKAMIILLADVPCPDLPQARSSAASAPKTEAKDADAAKAKADDKPVKAEGDGKP